MAHEKHFFDLPTEIRDAIYEFVFAGAEVRVRPCAEGPLNSFSMTFDGHRAILLASRRTYIDGIKLFYQNADIQLEYMTAATVSKFARLPNVQNHVRRVKVDLLSQTAFSALAQTALQLTTLIIDDIDFSLYYFGSLRLVDVQADGSTDVSVLSHAFQEFKSYKDLKMDLLGRSDLFPNTQIQVNFSFTQRRRRVTPDGEHLIQFLKWFGRYDHECPTVWKHAEPEWKHDGLFD